MQEEVTQKTIALSVKTARVTADVLKNMLRKYLSGQKQKGKNPYKVGKQSYKELKSQGSGLSNIEITDGNIKSFERVAKKYRLDFALKKDSSTKPPTYYVFFKGQDTEMMNLAFKKYLGVQMNKKDKRFFWTNIAVVVAGIMVAATGFNPIWIIMTAQAVNGIFLPIIVFTLVYVTSRSRVMGQYKNSMIQNVLGAAVFLISLVIGINSLTSLF